MVATPPYPTGAYGRNLGVSRGAAGRRRRPALPKARAQAWEFAKFLISVEWYKLQTRYDLLIPSRVSVLDDWIQVVRGRFPSLEKVN